VGSIAGRLSEFSFARDGGKFCYFIIIKNGRIYEQKRSVGYFKYSPIFSIIKSK
jgi:hypothetical protein